MTMLPRKTSALFRHIETLHGDRLWGDVLDAGTGHNSLRWISSLTTRSWTAVTASPTMAEGVRAQSGVQMRGQDRLVIGNWSDPRLLAGERFDTVLLDYFIGAIEGFVPYWQEQFAPRLRPLVGGRMYVVGVDPYVPLRADDESGRLVGDIGRLRDACLLLAGERPYREFPMEWVLLQLQRNGFKVLDARRFAIRYRERFINGQLDMCIQRLERLEDTALAATLRTHVGNLRARALDACQRLDGLRHGHDYVIAATPSA
jgi:hypothetical protein